MGRDYKLVFWLTCGVVISCRSVLKNGGGECMIISSIFMAECV